MAEEAKKQENNDKKTILITGSSTGIGKATAKYFQEKGWNVIATMRSPDKEKELNKLDNVLVTTLDVTKQKTIINSINEGIKKFGKIDVLCNNAGYGCLGIVEATAMDKIQRNYNVNVFGLIDCCQCILPTFRKQKSGVIINITSVGGKMVFPTSTIYNSTKFAVEGFSEGLYYELEPLGINVKIVEPGAIKTEFMSRGMEFCNDENLVEYQPFVKKVTSKFQGLVDAASEPLIVAEVIYKAATDNTNQLRYMAGKDCEKWLADRKKMDDKTFMGNIQKMMDI